VAVSRRCPLRAVALAAACVFGLCASPVAQQPPGPSDLRIDAALRMAADEDAARAFLDVHRLQARAGGENGPVLGWVTTPFSRIVLAGVAARKAGHPFTPRDVPADLLFPELVVIATPQPAADVANAFARITEVAVETRVGSEVTDMLLPLRMRAATPQERTFQGVQSAPGAVAAVFALDAVAPMLEAPHPNIVVRVSFDRVTCGSTAFAGCKDCVASIYLLNVH